MRKQRAAGDRTRTGAAQPAGLIGEESEDRFRLAMDHSAIGMCLVSPEGRFLTVNPALCEMLDRDAETLAAATWQELTHPDDLDVDLGLVDEVLSGRIPSYRLVKRFLRPDGTLVWGDLSVACVRSDDGSVRYFISQIVDVSAQVEAERALRQSEARCRAITDTAADAVVTADVGGTITGWNTAAERMFGFSEVEAVGNPVTMIMPERYAAGHPAAMERFRGGTERQTSS